VHLNRKEDPAALTEPPDLGGVNVLSQRQGDPVSNLWPAWKCPWPSNPDCSKAVCTRTPPASTDPFYPAPARPATQEVTLKRMPPMAQTQCSFDAGGVSVTCTTWGGRHRVERARPGEGAAPRAFKGSPVESTVEVSPICSSAKAAKHACRLANVSLGAIKTCPRGATSRQRQPSAPVIRAQNPARWYTSTYIAALPCVINRGC